MSDRNFIEFRGAENIRDIPDIRRRQLYPETLLSQYDNSRRLKDLLHYFETRVDPYTSIDEFYAAEFNPLTAFGWGLDVWGRIVGIDRTVLLQGNPFSFGFFGSYLKPFGQGAFYSIKEKYRFIMNDDIFRLMIFIKAAINITTGTLSALNTIFTKLFSAKGKVFVLHAGTMRLRLVFRFHLSLYERALFSREIISPIPAGVGYDIYEAPMDTFGFCGSKLKNFNNGTFARPPYDACKNYLDIFGYKGIELKNFNWGTFTRGYKHANSK